MMTAYQNITEFGQYNSGDWIYSPSRIYFALMEANGQFNIYRGRDPADPQKVQVWSTIATLPPDCDDPRLKLRKGPFNNNLKNLQIFMSSRPGEAVDEDDRSGALRQLWASGGSRDLTNPMEGWLGDDGKLFLQQLEQGVWKEKWNNGFSDPIVSFEAAEMDYDFAKAIITANAPKAGAELTGDNGLPYPPPQELTFTLSYAQTTSISFKTTTTLKIGAKTTLKTGIPGIVDGEVEMSTEVTQGFEWNKTTTDTVTKTATVRVLVPPCQSVTAWMTWTESTFTVPYTCEGMGIFASGAKMPVNVVGIYDGIAAQKLTAKWVPGKPVCETPAPDWLASGEHTERVAP